FLIHILFTQVLKLLEDKNSYQVTAKEALRKVYQERCDALQMLSKMELAYANSDGECKILRDQIMSTKQSLQDVNTRLQRLETDYNEYKEEAERKQQEIKEQEEQRIADISEKLQQRELECDDLRRRVSEFMLQHAELVDDEEKKLQLQAIEKLDAVIGDMDLGEDDDDEDENENEAKGDEGDIKSKEDGNEKECAKNYLHQPRVTKSLDAMNGVDTKILISSAEKEVLNTSSQSDVALKKIKQKGNAKESTILKWLQNSDLNQKEGSFDIFKAICNESDSSDEHDLPVNENDAVNVDSESGIDTNTTSLEEIKLKYKKSKNKLQSVQAILCQLVEAEMAKECYKSTGADVTEHIDAENENEALKLSRKEDECTSKNDEQRLALLKSSVAILNEAYKELCDSLTEQELHKSLAADIKEISPPPTITVQTQLQNNAPSKTGGSATSKLLSQDTLKPLTEAVEDEAALYDLDENNLSTAKASKNDECTTTVTTPSTIVSPGDVADREMSISDEVRAYQDQIKELNLKLEQVESDAQNTLEIMQIECDTFKEKVTQLSKVVQKACEEKKELERLLDERTSMEKTVMPAEQINDRNEQQMDAVIKLPLSAPSLPLASETKNEFELHESFDDELLSSDNKSVAGGKMDADFETQLREDLAAINSTALQREEELIVYKERLEKTQNDNLQLRNDIAALLLKSGTQAQTHMVKQMLAYGTAVLAIIVYLFTMYF
ncbi:PREDICTED: sarcolemmal membrane-associated protein-like, partial [Rhagoletis zephyria]|uniref:sarcolemmal membrane-associated protein-like n=1 Tax=Rhagoletis zephyria TaxID=28612 RepID=UPI0008119264